MTSRSARVVLAIIITLSIAIALHAIGFQARLSGSPEFHARLGQMPIASTLHVLGGAAVLVLGGFQFSTRLRNARPALHRWCGRIYLVLVALSGIGGLVMAPFSDGGSVAHFGFGMLALLWLYSGWRAYAAIRSGDVAMHRVWMLRNFALTFAAVTLRIYLGLFALYGMPFSDVYPVVAWLSWVPNLIVVEWFVANHSREPHGAS